LSSSHVAYIGGNYYCTEGAAGGGPGPTWQSPSRAGVPEEGAPCLSTPAKALGVNSQLLQWGTERSLVPHGFPTSSTKAGFFSAADKIATTGTSKNYHRPISYQ